MRTRQLWKQSIRLKNAIRTVLVIKKETTILNNENGKNQEIPEYTFSFAFRINIKRVRRIMRKHGIKANVRQKKRNRKQEQQQYQEDNLLERKFIHVAPKLEWVSDTTEIN